MFVHKSLVDIISESLYGKKVKLFKFTHNNIISYYFVKDVDFSGPKKFHPKPIGEAVGLIVNFEGETDKYDGDSISLIVLIDDKPFNLHIGSITDILIIS